MSATAETVPVSTATIEDPVARRAFRKAVVRLVPILILAFVISYVDRTNIGFAALSMNKDLGLSNTAFGFGAGVLFFGYCGFELPSTWLMHRVGARRWIARIMITWGIISGLTAFVVGPQSFYFLRFLLGVAEAGFTPGGMYFFSLWFPPQFRGRIMAWFQLGVPLASLISGPVSVAVLQADGLLGLPGWKWLFILEGLPAILLGIATLFVLTDRPEQASWLDPQEREAIKRTLAAEKRDRPVGDFWAALVDWRVLALAAIQFGFTIGSYGVGIWLPLILKQHNLSITAIGWLAALPYLFGCIASIVWASGVDRSGARTTNLFVTCLVGALGLVFSVLFPALWPSMIGITIAVIGITAARGIFWSLPPRFLTGQGAAGGLALINSIGTLGGFFGPVLMGWLKDETGSFSASLYVLAGLMAMSAAMTLVFRFAAKQN